MANEIQISAVTGLTPSIQLYNGVAPYGTPFAATEIGTTGEYIASMPSAPYGVYLVLVTVGADVKIGSGEIFWDGDYELNQSVAMLRGLDPNNPATQTLTELSSGSIDIAVSGDLTTTTTFTRNP
jgi:hypothetical protein